MLKTRNKQRPSTKSTRAARKGGPYDLRHSFRRGDRVRITDIPSDLKNPGYEDDPQMRTAALFRFCLGKKFVVRGFDRYGFVELRVDDDPAVKRKFGLNSIWVEPKSIQLISKTRRRIDRPDNGLGWREDFLEGEQKFAGMDRSLLAGQNGKEKKACNSKLTIRCIL